MSLILVVSTVLVGGCGGGGGGKDTIVQGWVSAEGPVSSANLTFYDITGEQIYQTEESVTGDFGSFLISVNNLPSDFRVVATGGTHDGEVYSEELSVDCRGFDAGNDTIYINAVTTMASAYLDKYPATNLDEAEADVKGFLEIPDWVDIGRGVHDSNEYFSYYSFQEEANQNEGVGLYIDQLVAEMHDNPTSVTHSFPAGMSLNAVPWTTGWAVEGLGWGALSFTGGNLFGWALSQAGIGFGDETSEAIANMQWQLQKISQQLDALDSKMTQMYNELSREIKQSEYDIRIGQLNNLKSAIKSAKDDLTLLATDPPSKADLLERKRQDVVKIIRDDILPYRNVIDDVLTSSSGSQVPLLKLWSQTVRSNHRFLSAADYTAIETQFAYFDTLQVTMLELLLEYYHYIGEGEDDHQGIDAVRKAYQDNIAVQKAMLLPVIPDGVYLDQNNNLMIWMPDGFRATVTPDFEGMTTTVDGGFIQILDMRTKSHLGFDDWRYPSADEVMSFFKDWNSNAASAWEYAQAQGFVVIKRELFIPNLLTNTWEQQWVTMNNQGCLGYYLYWTTSGVWNFLPRDACHNYVNVVPVRNMAPGEVDKYFW